MGKDKLRRFAEMADFPNVLEPQLDEVLHANHRLKGKWKEEIFKNDHPLILELGCGKGEYTIGLAKAFPKKNFMGLDIKGARMWKGAKMGITEQLKNAFFLRTRIDFITSFFGKNEVDEIWITFPDPQLKESRERKRLTSPMFLDRYAQFLHPDGVIHLKTDSAELYEYTMELIRELKFNILENTADLYNPNTTLKDKEVVEPLLKIQTFYESMFLKKGKKICYLKFQLHGNH